MGGHRKRPIDVNAETQNYRGLRKPVNVKFVYVKFHQDMSSELKPGRTGEGCVQNLDSRNQFCILGIYLGMHNGTYLGIYPDAEFAFC